MYNPTEFMTLHQFREAVFQSIKTHELVQLEDLCSSFGNTNVVVDMELIQLVLESLIRKGLIKQDNNF